MACVGEQPKGTIVIFHFTGNFVVEQQEEIDFAKTIRINLPPLAWYGASWVYTDPEPEPEPPVVEEQTPPAQPKPGEPPDFGPERRPGEGRGVILGRFMPPHAGHQYLVDFARIFTPNLTVFLYEGKNPEINGHLREAWLKELFPGLNIVRIEFHHALEGLGQPAAKQAWADLIKYYEPRPDYVFASEDYGPELANRLGAAYVPVDPQRRVFPVSGTQIRENPAAHWEYLPPCVHAFYTRRVCLIGPESSGKSTLAWRLATHYNTVCTDEFARTISAARDSRWLAADTQTIAIGQVAAEAALSRRANRVLFCDTDILAVWLWCERLFGASPAWLREAAAAHTRDLYLLTKPDAPFAGATDSPVDRTAFYERCCAVLEERKLPFVEIGGSWDERFQQAKSAVDSLLQKQ